MTEKSIQIEYNTFTHAMKIFLPDNHILEIDGFSSDVPCCHIKTLEVQGQKQIIKALVGNL